jgi:hypothetical protein
MKNQIIQKFHEIGGGFEKTNTKHGDTPGTVQQRLENLWFTYGNRYRLGIYYIILYYIIYIFIYIYPINMVIDGGIYRPPKLGMFTH